MSIRQGNAAPVSEGSGAHGASERRQCIAAVRELLVSLDNAAWGRDWKGRAGLTDRSVYVALIRAAWRHGESIPSGVRISIAVRPLAIGAGVSKPTALAAVERLTLRHGLVRRDGRGEGPRSGAFVLLTGPRSAYPLEEDSQRRETVSPRPPECVSSARPALRWGRDRLGKTKEYLMDALGRLGGATERELAVAMGRRPRDLRPHLNALEELGIVGCQGDVYELEEDAFFSLCIERDNNGEGEAEERDQRQYREESDAFREKWDRGEVRKKSGRRVGDAR